MDKIKIFWADKPYADKVCEIIKPIITDATQGCFAIGYKGITLNSKPIKSVIAVKYIQPYAPFNYEKILQDTKEKAYCNLIHLVDRLVKTGKAPFRNKGIVHNLKLFLPSRKYFFATISVPNSTYCKYITIKKQDYGQN